jgi:hypothetical protein
MTDAALHVVPNAGDPQPDPGRWPMRRVDHASIVTWLKYRGRVYCDTPHRAALDGMCKGCLSSQRTIAGFVLPHEPAPPQHHWCSECPEPMAPPSYTPAPHPWCTPGEADTDGYGE